MSRKQTTSLSVKSAGSERPKISGQGVEQTWTVFRIRRRHERTTRLPHHQARQDMSVKKCRSLSRSIDPRRRLDFNHCRLLF